MKGRPNILWIIPTQWRAQAFGYAGDPNARTPVIDALAAESVNFAQAVTPHPFGPFARAAMMTGIPSPENGVKDYFDPLPPSAHTVAHELRDLNYSTAYFGKWHLSKRDPSASLVGDSHAKIVIPREALGGFEFFEGFESGFLLNDPWLHGTRLPEPVQFKGYQSDILCDRAAGWIGDFGNRKSETGEDRTDAEGTKLVDPEERPFFCVVSMEAPHPPYDAPASGIARPEPRMLVLPKNVPLGGEVETKVRRELAGYYAHIEATDRAIGRLLAKAKHEDTVVVFTSVHGDMHGAHGLLRKGWPHEESVRVPLLLRMPAVAACRDEAAVSLVELLAMTTDVAEGKLPAPARSKFARISMPSVVKLKHQCDCIWRGVRTKKRKLVLNDDGTTWLFFDLERDPLEMKNLAEDPTRAAEIAELKRMVK